MRFGSSAKLIENKIRANIIKNSDEEGVKAMISDYESKLKDFNYSIEQVQELEQQKKNLENRLSKANSQNINKFSQEIPKIEANLGEAIIHWKNLGIINSSTRVSEIVNTAKIESGWKVAS